MTNKREGSDTSKQAHAFVDLQAAVRDVLSGNVVRAFELHKALAKSSAELARLMIDTAARSHRDITQMVIDAMSTGDPVALMTLAPRAAQTGLRDGMACANRALQSAQALGNTFAAVSETTKGGADRS